MAAKKNNAAREARMAKNNRNLNRAMTLFTVGFAAEFYFLLMNNFLVKGSVGQVAAAATFLEVFVWVGCALMLVGLVLMWVKRFARYLSLSRWLLVLGVCVTLSSRLMLDFYPTGTTALCIGVPVAMLLSVVLLLYQREFSVQALALTFTIVAAVLMNRGSTIAPTLLRGICVVLLLAVAALTALVLAAKKNGGALRGVQLFPAKTGYALVLGVLALCLLGILLALFAGAAYYVVWGAAAALFALAVWYTVKML